MRFTFLLLLTSSIWAQASTGSVYYCESKNPSGAMVLELNSAGTSKGRMSNPNTTDFSVLLKKNAPPSEFTVLYVANVKPLKGTLACSDCYQFYASPYPATNLPEAVLEATSSFLKMNTASITKSYGLKLEHFIEYNHYMPMDCKKETWK